MGKSKIEYMTRHESGSDVFFCVHFESGAHHNYSEADLPKTARLFWDSADISSEVWCDSIRRTCEYASKLTEEPSARIEAFYTGGGLWLCGAYIDQNTYVCTDNDMFGDGFCIYDHREEDQDTDFPCQNPIGGKDFFEMNHEEIQLYNALRKALLREMC